MIPFIGATGLFSLVVGWSITIHLFSLSRRTGALPERLLGIAFGVCSASASRSPG